MKHMIAAACLTAALGTPVAADAAEPTTLRFGFTSPRTSYVYVYGAEPWIKEVEAASQGTLKIQMFFSNALGTVFNIYQRTVDGVTDISFGTLGTVGGVFPRSTVSDLPFVSEDPYEASLALWRLHERGVIAEEYRLVKPLALFTFSSSSIHTARQIRTMEDMKGLKMGAFSKFTADAYSLLGAVPLSMAPAEAYEALLRGLIVGCNMSWPAVISFKLNEVAKNHLDIPLGFAGGYFFMNKEAYARLPEAARKAIDTYSGEPLAKKMGLGGLEINKEVIARLRGEPDRTVATLAPDEMERWRKLLVPIADNWVKTTPDGANVLAAYQAEVEKIRGERR